MALSTERILIIGAAGQIGSELTIELRRIYGQECVFATDVKMPDDEIFRGGPFQILDVLDDKMLIHFIIRHKITQIYHLAAVLSGNAEKLPVQAWNINMDSLLNVLEIARMVDKVKKIFWPSSIAVFGPTTQKKMAPQRTVMEPTTVYGITKIAGERWCAYYHRKYGIDIRSIRYPGLISHKTEAGGGTTDYAVDIYFDAVSEGRYECFIKEDTFMPFLFMPDAIRATVELMEARRNRLTVSGGYNLAGMSHCPDDFFREIRKHIPDFQISYVPDFRQEIAESWPDGVDDTITVRDWGFSPKYDLASMTKVMLKEVKKKAK